MGDNGENGASVEAIFPILQDGLKTTSWGTTLFLMAGSTDENVHIKDIIPLATELQKKWGGNRCRPNLIQKFFPNNDAPTVGAYAMPEAAKVTTVLCSTLLVKAALHVN